jgi:glutathione reductase (NADPH)
MKELDLLVLGTGSAGSKPAYKCREAGWSVAVVESRPLGGTCALRGCDPKKILVGAAAAVDWQRRMVNKGIEDAGRIDWPSLVRFKRSIIDPRPAQRREAYAEAEIEVLEGRARFVDPSTVEVGGEKVRAKHILIATGAAPAKLGFAGEEHVITSTDFLELDRLPKRIAFIGGGFISCEFAHVARRAGAEVTILHRGKRPLEAFDADMVEHVTKHTRAIGIDLRTENEVCGVQRSGSGFTVCAKRDGKDVSVEVDLVVHGAGREPEIEDLDLDAANVKREKRGVVVNDYLQSVSNPIVYAAGDCAATGAPQLTPTAAIEGHVVASNLLKGNKRTADYTGLASAVFTIPPLAQVGLIEEEARKKGLEYRVATDEMSSWYNSRRVAEEAAAFKVLISKDDDTILGASILCPEAEEVINVFAVAIRAGVTAAKMRQMPFCYPSIGSDIPYML